MSQTILLRVALAAVFMGAVPATAQVTGLTFRPVDAAYSTALDKVVFVSANPNQLHIYDPVANSDQPVALTAAPQNVCLAPDGQHAAVSFSNAVVYVNLQTAAVANTFSNVAVGTGVPVCGAGYIYIFPPGVPAILSIEIATGVITTSNSFDFSSGGTFDAALNAVYSTQGGSPNSLERFDASGGAIGSETSEPNDYFAVFNICGPLWLSGDGSTIYSACGPVYSASADPTKDMRYLGILPGLSLAQSMAVSDALGEVAVIPTVISYSQPATPNADTVVNLFATASFHPLGQFSTTPFTVNGGSYAAHGRWVFYNSSASNMFIITEADSTAGLEKDYAIEDVKLTAPNSCKAAFGSASASAVAPGSYAIVPIVSGEDCVFTAVSNAPWITLASGYYGSGNGTLEYLVRPNLSATPRSGTISLGAETFTVNQDAAGPATAFHPLSFEPVAAAYDAALDKIVMVSASPNELHIYDPVTLDDQVVPLTYLPLSLAVRPDGLFAAVGHSGEVSIVDLKGKTVSTTFHVDMDNGGMAYAMNGYAYAFPSQTSSWGEITSIQISTGTLSQIEDVYYGNIPRLDVSGNYLYVSSFEGSSKLDISNGAAKLVESLYGNLNGNIWLSEDGNRLISSNGSVYFTAGLEPDGQLSGTNNLAWAADSQVQQQIAVLTDPTQGTPANTQLQIYASNGLQLKSQESLPSFSNNGSSYVSHGKYLFWNSAESKLFALIEADSTSGLLSDYAVYTVAAPESLPACTYSVSPASLNVPPSSFLSWTLAVTSNCDWTATELNDSTWIGLESSTISGNGQVTISPGNNTGAARSGSILIGNQSVTINQAASTCSYALSSTSAAFSQLGGSGTVTLTTGAGCAWSVQSDSSWLTVKSQSGTGSATIHFTAAAATTSPVFLNGNLNIAGNDFAVSETTTTGPLSAATYLGYDTTTQGNWLGQYGADGYSIANKAGNEPAYATVSLSENGTYTWTTSTTDPRALQTAPSGRIASAYYAGGNFKINVNISDGGTHRVALYLLDWDSKARAETITISDAVSNAVLDTESFSGFHNGEYVSWNIQGNVNIEVTKTGGSNGVVAGIFFDPVRAAASANYSGVDITTQGKWTGFYGGDGELLANAANSVPAYAAVSVTGAGAYTWTASTSDPRALQTANGSLTQRAAAYYATNSFTLNVNLTDGNSHQLTLYLLDWDTSSRSETISLVDVYTNKVLDSESFSNFHGGQYISWNVQGHVLIQVTRTGGQNAVLSGIFFDPAASGAAASYFGLDTATQGSWTRHYGSSGYSIANDATNLSAFAAVKVSGDTAYTWASSTSDTRALQTASGSSTRIASTYYSGSSFAIDVNLTDGTKHKISLYLLDWDGSARAETIKIVNADNNTVLDTESYSGFHNGAWAAWNVKGHVVIEVTKTGGSNAVVSGIFVD